jgi:ATP-binding cassette subfamily C protein
VSEQIVGEEAAKKLSDSPQPGINGSLNYVDMASPSIFWAIKKSVSMLPRQKRTLLYIATAIQVSLGIFDLIGIALIGLVAAVAVSGIGLTTIPDWAQNLLDNFGLGSLTVSQLSVVIAVAAVATLVIKSILSALMTRKILRFLAARQADLSVSLASAFLRRPLSEVQRWTTSEAIYALGSGASGATVALLGSAITIAAELFFFTIIGVSLLIYSPIITIASGIFFTVIILILQKILGAWSAKNAETIKDTSIDTYNAVAEALITYRESTVLDRRDLYIERYSGVIERNAVATASNAFYLEVPKYILEVALYSGMLILGAIQFLTQDWATAAATVALFLAAGSRVIPSMLRLQGAGITIRNASVTAQPTFLMFDQLKAVEESNPEPVRSKFDIREEADRIHERIRTGYPAFNARIIVENVSLTFSDATKPVLSQISFTVNPGESLALVGATGAGKSTLADLILGVLSPDTGHVTIGGSVPRVAIIANAGAIAYVPQNVALIAGSIRQNVALGIPESLVDDELVWEALRRAHLDHFLIGEREGISTQIGERGFKISGGQRQRLGIARALYTRPKILVLDEATSALDSETEQAITQTLDELEGAVTTVTVAHRLVTVQNADQLLFLENGIVEARGTFAEVRSQSPAFDRQAKLLGL